ncbi:MAG: GNAT family N-acetyltransferase [Gemmatimonadaceae bacterium]
MLLPDQVPLELAVDDIDLDAHGPLIARLEREGVRFTTLAEEERTEPAWLERIADLDNATRAGDPAVPRTPEEMRARLAALEVAPDATFIAVSGERYVGYTVLDPAGSEGRSLLQSWTGVHPAHRRRGIATALKVLGVRYARAHGYDRVITAPRATNVASLGMSTKLGFRRAVGREE